MYSANSLLENSIVIIGGGVDDGVETDESMFVRRKNHIPREMLNNNGYIEEL